MQPYRQTALTGKIGEAIFNGHSVINASAGDVKHLVKDGKIVTEGDNEIVLNYTETAKYIYNAKLKVDRIYSDNAILKDVDTGCNYYMSSYTLGEGLSNIPNNGITIDANGILTCKVYMTKASLAFYREEQDYFLFPDKVTPKNMVRGTEYKLTNGRALKYLGKVAVTKQLYRHLGYNEGNNGWDETELVSAEGYLRNNWNREIVNEARKLGKVGQIVGEFNIEEEVQRILTEEQARTYLHGGRITSITLI